MKKMTSAPHIHSPIIPLDKLFKASKTKPRADEHEAKLFLQAAIQRQKELSPRDFHRFIMEEREVHEGTTGEAVAVADVSRQLGRLKSMAEALISGNKSYKSTILAFSKAFADSQVLGWPPVQLKKNKDVAEALNKLVKEVVKAQKTAQDESALREIRHAEETVLRLAAETSTKADCLTLCTSQDRAFKEKLADVLVVAFEHSFTQGPQQGNMVAAQTSLEAALEELRTGMFHVADQVSVDGKLLGKAPLMLTHFLKEVVDVAGLKIYNKFHLRFHEQAERLKENLETTERLYAPYVAQTHAYLHQFTVRHAACVHILDAKLQEVRDEISLFLKMLGLPRKEQEEVSRDIMTRLQARPQWQYAVQVRDLLQLRLTQIPQRGLMALKLPVKAVLDPYATKVQFKERRSEESAVTLIERHFAMPKLSSAESGSDDEEGIPHTLLADESKHLTDLLEAVYRDLYSVALSVFEDRQLQASSDDEDVFDQSTPLQVIAYQHFMELHAKALAQPFFSKNAFGPLVGVLAADPDFRAQYGLRGRGSEAEALQIQETVRVSSPEQDWECHLTSQGVFVSSYGVLSRLPLTQASVMLRGTRSADPHAKAMKAHRMESDILETHVLKRQGTEGVFSLTEESFKACPLTAKLSLLQEFSQAMESLKGILGGDYNALMQPLFGDLILMERADFFARECMNTPNTVLDRLLVGRGISGRLSRASSRSVSRQSSEESNTKPLSIAEFAEVASVIFSLSRLFSSIGAMVSTSLAPNARQVWIFRESFMRTSDKSEKVALALSHKCNEFLAYLEDHRIPLLIETPTGQQQVIIRQRLHNTAINNGTVLLEPVLGDPKLEAGISALYFSQLEADMARLNQQLTLLSRKTMIRVTIQNLQRELNENVALQKQFSKTGVHTGIFGSNTVLLGQLVMRLARLFELAQLLLEKQGALKEEEIAAIRRAINCKSALDRTRVGQDTSIADSALGLTTSEIVREYAPFLPEPVGTEEDPLADYRVPLAGGVQQKHREFMLAQGPLHDRVLSSARIFSSNQPNAVNVACDYDNVTRVYGVPVKQITDCFSGFTKA